MNINSLYLLQPTYWIIACILLGILGTLLLYRKSNTLRDAPQTARIAVAVLRGSLITILALLLLEPYFRQFKTHTEKPTFIVLEDNSASIQNHFTKNDSSSYQEFKESQLAALAPHFNVQHYTFGNNTLKETAAKYNKQHTNISQALATAYNSTDQELLAGTLILSDGIFNTGQDPNYTAEKFNRPIFTYALGDTATYSDAYINKTFHNDIAYKGDKASLIIDIQAEKLNGQSSTLTVYDTKSKSTIHRKNININSDDYFSSVEVLLPINQTGVAHFIVQIAKTGDEKNLNNNRRDVFIEIIDSKKQIDILALSPHPDLGAIKKAIEYNKNYEVNIHYNTQKVAIEKTNILILHQISNEGTGTSALLQKASSLKIPTLYIVGQQTDLNQFNKIQSVININGNNEQTNTIRPALNKQFTNFKTDSLNVLSHKDLPPLNSIFGKYRLNPAAKTLFWQQIGKVKTEYPLVSFLSEGDYRQGILTAEGLWRWRLFEQQSNSQLVQPLLSKIVQYLGTTKNKAKFQVSSAAKKYTEQSNISFDGLLYNDSYELINTPDVMLELTNSKGEKFDYTFDRTTSAYNLNVGSLSAGSYQYKAQVEQNGKTLTSSGQILVEQIDLEQAQLTTNLPLLRNIAALTNGQSFEQGTTVNFADSILANTSTTPLLFSNEENTPVINWLWLFGILLALVSAEWIIRRYYGTI